MIYVEINCSHLFCIQKGIFIFPHSLRSRSNGIYVSYKFEFHDFRVMVSLLRFA